jgi:N utilization substance protein B
MLFQFDIAHTPLEELITTYWQEICPEARSEIIEFADGLVRGTLDNLAQLDEMISKRTENWRISRMAVVDRNLLRIAVYEFLHQPQTPRTVIINEALEIARRFSTYQATQFINGILDGIKRDMEKEVSLTAHSN